MGELVIDDSRAADGRREAVATIGAERFRIHLQRDDGPLAAPCSDSLVLAMLATFMRRNEAMHVSGRVTRRLLIGLEEWQRAFQRWRPDAYSRVDITADEILTGYPTSDLAVATFTGGVDSTYTAQRHLRGAAGNATVDLRAVLFVHGFDIPLDDQDGFDAACRRSSGYLARSGLELITVRTDLRAIGYDWEAEHGLAAAAVLTALAPEYGVGLIAATGAYHSQHAAWGSNPITDHLTSTGMMDIRYDGADASRVEKIGVLLDDPVAVAQLRFCWETAPHDRNCGVCTKCIRTACEFMANGVDDAACFTRWPTVDAIRSLRIKTMYYLEGLEWTLEIADAGGRSEDDWYRALASALADARRRLR